MFYSGYKTRKQWEIKLLKVVVFVLAKTACDHAKKLLHTFARLDFFFAVNC